MYEKLFGVDFSIMCYCLLTGFTFSPFDIIVNAEQCIVVHAKAREYVFTGVGLCVCLSVTTITKRL